jgi:hypothetical protein
MTTFIVLSYCAENYDVNLSAYDTFAKAMAQCVKLGMEEVELCKEMGEIIEYVVNDDGVAFADEYGNDDRGYRIEQLESD